MVGRGRSLFRHRHGVSGLTAGRGGGRVRHVLASVASLHAWCNVSTMKGGLADCRTAKNAKRREKRARPHDVRPRLESCCVCRTPRDHKPRWLVVSHVVRCAHAADRMSAAVKQARSRRLPTLWRRRRSGFVSLEQDLR